MCACVSFLLCVSTGRLPSNTDVVAPSQHVVVQKFLGAPADALVGQGAGGDLVAVSPYLCVSVSVSLAPSPPPQKNTPAHHQANNFGLCLSGRM